MEITDVKSSLWSISLATAGELVEGIAHINQCIEIVLKTRRGADSLRPEFGCSILEKLDRPVNEVLSSLVDDVVKALNLWIPEITVVKVTSELLTGQLTVNVQWAFNNTIDTKQVNTTYGVNYKLAA